MIAGLLKMAGMGIMILVYGKEQYSKKWASNPEAPTVFVQCILSLVTIFWLLALLILSSGAAASDTVLCIIFAVAYPVAIAIWAIIARKRG